MKKAIVVGGSNGIGLAIANNLISKGYYVCVFDKNEPDIKSISSEDNYEYHYCDLTDFDVSLFEEYVKDTDVNVLMITAGYGRVADFENLHISEIEGMLTVNSISAIKIIRVFYDRIKSGSDFYCGVMGSIAGLVSSPMFSVYAASKAAICRFVESVNIELEVGKVTNRILNVSPGSIKGTKFNGGENNIDLIKGLAENIVEKLFCSEQLYIPDYDTIYKGVIERYKADSHAFGVSSYEYKKASGRVVNEKKAVIGYLSGTFDLFHIGHLNLLRRAKKECDYLIVGVHSDASHKGKTTFIDYESRKAIVGSVKYVDKVVMSCKEDCDAWELWHYNRLFVGSDYKNTERFRNYEEFFKDKDVEIVYFPYTQGVSSTDIRKELGQTSKSILK